MSLHRLSVVAVPLLLLLSLGVVSAIPQANDFLTFNGNQYSQITTKNNMPAGLTDRSLSVWVRISIDIDIDFCLASFSDNDGTCGHKDLQFYINKDHELCASTCAGGSWCMPKTKGTVPSDGQWHYCALSYTAATQALVVAIDTIISDPFAGVVLDTSIDIAIMSAKLRGLHDTPSCFYRGDMSEFHMYSLPLNPTSFKTDMDCNGTEDPVPFGICIRFVFTLTVDGKIIDSISLCVAIIINCPTPTPTPTPTPIPFVIGDPVLMGFDGVRHQVHGIPGEIYNLLSMSTVQVNARFTLMSSPPHHSLPSSRLQLGKSAQLHTRHEDSGLMIDVRTTQGWTHSGTYLGAIGLLVSDEDETVEHRLLIEPGSFSRGWQRLVIDGYDYVRHETGVAPRALPSFIAYMTSHVVVVSTPSFLMTLVSSQHFINIHQIALFGSNSSSTRMAIHGLIGRTYPNANTRESTSTSKTGVVMFDDRDGPSTPLQDEDLMVPVSSEMDEDDNTRVSWSAYAIDQFRLVDRSLFGTQFSYNRYNETASSDRFVPNKATNTAMARILKKL